MNDHNSTNTLSPLNLSRSFTSSHKNEQTTRNSMESGDFYDALDTTPPTPLQFKSLDSTKFCTTKDTDEYIQLNNLAGLTSPDHGNQNMDSVLDDDHNSVKGSIISSLSSFSQEVGGAMIGSSHVRRSSNEFTDGGVEEEITGSDIELEIDPGIPDKGRESGTSIEEEGLNSPYNETKEIDQLVQNKLFMINEPCPVLENHAIKSTTTSIQLIYKDVKATSPGKHHKNHLFHNNIRLVQKVNYHEGSVWVMKFSPSENYLCTAGQDTKVVVWAIGSILNFNTSSSSNRRKSREDSISAKVQMNPNSSSTVPVPFINPTPYRIFEGHSSEIIDLAWSKSNFILSASTDKTVRLWHLSRTECVQFFRHPDIVTSVEFDPIHDRYFVSGCFDRRLRVWDIIPAGSVKEWSQTPVTITSVCFSPDGQTVVGGLMNGQLYFYEYDGMKYKTQMDCKNRAGQFKNGCKITGLTYLTRKTFVELNSQSIGLVSSQRRKQIANNNAQLLVTTNDSRIRLCQTQDYSVQFKYKGLQNSRGMQIKSSYSDDGVFVICGSDDGMIHIWDTIMNSHLTVMDSIMGGGKKNRNVFCTSFHGTENSDVPVTAVAFSPMHVVQAYVKSNRHLVPYDFSGSVMVGDNNVILPNDQIESSESSNKILNNSSIHLQKGRKLSQYGNSGSTNQSLNTQQNSGQASASSSFRTNVESESDGNNPIDIASRVIVTADIDGTLRVYFRIGNMQ